MKKLLVLLLTITLVLSGCSKKNEPAKEEKPSTTEAPKETEVTKKALKTGYAVGLTHELKEGEDAQNLTAEAEVAAVLVDQDGKVVEAKLDVSQAKFSFDDEGMVTPNEVTEFLSKMTLKEAYNMKEASPIKKEWYEQAKALTDYLVGKTKDEVMAIALDQEGKPTSDDLKTSVTMKIGTYVKLFVQAIDNAKEIGAMAGDKLALGLYTDSYNSKPDEGKAQAYSFYTVLSTNAEDIVTSMVIDASVPYYLYDENEPNLVKVGGYEDRTKQQLKEEYGMKEASPIKKEWYEQANALAQYLVGKKADTLTTFKLKDNKFEETPEELTTSVTVKISGIQKAVEYALANR